MRDTAEGHRPETRETWIPVSGLIVTELCRFMPLTWFSSCTMPTGLQAVRLGGCQSPFSVTLIITFLKSHLLVAFKAAWPTDGQSLELLKTHRYQVTTMPLLSSVTPPDLGRCRCVSILVYTTGKQYLMLGWSRCRMN